MIDLVWIVPVCVVGVVGFLSAEWRLLAWLQRDHHEALDRWMERLFPGISGKVR